jgi:hypothetical protein
MLMIVVVVLVGVAALFEQKAPQALAQYEGWKTYYNYDLKFAIDYPSYSESARPTTNITESTNRVVFEMYNLLATINIDSNSAIELEEYTVFMQQGMLKDLQRELVQSVETVVYNRELGYSFALYDPSDGLYSQIMFFHSPNDINKHYRVMFVGTNPVGGPPFYEIDEIMNSIRFFRLIFFFNKWAGTDPKFQLLELGWVVCFCFS